MQRFYIQCFTFHVSCWHDEFLHMPFTDKAMQACVYTLTCSQISFLQDFLQHDLQILKNFSLHSTSEDG